MVGKAPMNSQKGVALILSLLLLFVLVILGVSGFNNTHVQERGAGNARLQAVAFEAASAGANNAINFFKDLDGRPADPDQLCGSSEHLGWMDAEGKPLPTAWVNLGNVGGATLQQRLYCLADEFPCSELEVGCVAGQRPPRSQLFVQSRGEVLATDGKVVAQRDVEVRLEIGRDTGASEGCGAICFPACEIGTMEFGSSNEFQVDGNGNPAITTGCEAGADIVRDAAIEVGRYGNYLGGIEYTPPGAPWSDPLLVEQFRQNLYDTALNAPADTCQQTCFSAGNLTLNGNRTLGTPGDPQVTYINGNADFGGNISGAGILVVKGNLHWGGTPKFDGLILVLGGSFDFNGGGGGGDHGGSVVLLNTNGVSFSPVNFTFNGGGNALYKFDCGKLKAARETLLNEAGQGMWSPECEFGPQNPYEATPDELIIASWRENIGWRECLFEPELPHCKSIIE